MIVPVDGGRSRAVVVALVLGLIGAAGAGVSGLLSGRALLLSLAAPTERRDLPVIVDVTVWQIDDRAGFGQRHGMGEPFGEQSTLPGDVVRQAGGVAKRKVDEDRAGRVGADGDAAGRGEPDRWDSGCFDVACDQTDRLVADRSNGHEQNEVWLLGLAPFEEERHGLRFEPTG